MIREPPSLPSISGAASSQALTWTTTSTTCHPHCNSIWVGYTWIECHEDVLPLDDSHINGSNTSNCVVYAYVCLSPNKGGCISICMSRLCLNWMSWRCVLDDSNIMAQIQVTVLSTTYYTHPYLAVPRSGTMTPRTWLILFVCANRSA